MRKTGTVIFTLAGGLYIASPGLEAYHLIPETPESPPLAALALVSTAPDTQIVQVDTVRDEAIDVGLVSGVPAARWRIT
jgi:hypothetical protein